MGKQITICCCILLTLIGKHAYTQSFLCPPNIDFSSGSFNNWECLTGTVSVVGGNNLVALTSTGELPDRHQLISPTNNQLDPYGQFPQHCPNSGSYTVKLGNDKSGHEAEGLVYSFTIPSNNTSFSLLYRYAIVLQDPRHSKEEQPRFRARIIDVNDQTEISCVSFDFSASGQLPGFKPSQVNEVIYKDWTSISVDLSAYAGKAIRLEFITSDCVFNEHFGYAYINIASICNGRIFGNNYCDGDTATKVVAPDGFRRYAWYADTTFSRQLGNAQELLLNLNSTPVGTVLPVIVTPYPGYGCLDTLYAAIGAAQKPNSQAGPDKTTCSKTTVQLGTLPTGAYSYSWTPGNKLSSPFIANPFTVVGLLNPTQFVVRTTDLLTGCADSDSVTITPIVVDTSSSVVGKMNYCPKETLSTILSVNNTGASAEWFRDDVAIAGTNSLTCSPQVVGRYWAMITQSGCTDTSRVFTIHQAPLPKPGFSISKEIECLNEPVVFTNKTTITGNEPVSYLWRFSDGTSSRQLNTEKVFKASGIYAITLVATSGTDCIDSTRQQVMIVKDCMPIMPGGFTPNSDGKNDELRPILTGAKALKRFTVYNRWGDIVFSTTREGSAWDGTNKGSPSPTGVFVWIVEYIAKNNRIVTQSGTVTLIR